MDPGGGARERLQRAWREQRALVVAGALLGLLPVGAVALTGFAFDTPPQWILRDLTHLPEVPGWEYGLAPRATSIFLSAAAGIAIIAGLVALRDDDPLAWALVGLGVLTVAVASDNVLLIHEPVTERTGVPIVELLYVATVIFVLGRFHREILSRTPWLLGGIGLLALATSMGLDFLDDNEILVIAKMVEDAPKLFGFVVWSLYLVVVSWDLLTRENPEQGVSLNERVS